MDKTKTLNLIDDSSFKMLLKEVTFERLDDLRDPEGKVEVSLKTKDDYKVLESNEGELVLEFKREKYFEPNSIFKIKIIINIKYKLRNDSKTKNLDKYIKSEIDKNIDILLAPAAAHSSIIISTLTSIDWSVPIIDPPFLIRDSTEEHGG